MTRTAHWGYSSDRHVNWLTIDKKLQQLLQESETYCITYRYITIFPSVKLGHLLLSIFTMKQQRYLIIDSDAVFLGHTHI